MELKASARPERISRLAQYLYDKEPLMYLFIINADFYAVESLPLVGKEGYAAVSFANNRIQFYHIEERLNSLTAEELYFLLLHEAYHIFKKHTSRLIELFQEDRMLANVSADATINWEIGHSEFNYDLKPKMIKGGVLLPQRYMEENRSLGNDAIETHRIFNWLKKVKEENSYSYDFVRVKNKKTGEKGRARLGDFKGDDINVEYDESEGRREKKEDIVVIAEGKEYSDLTDGEYQGLDGHQFEVEMEQGSKVEAELQEAEKDGFVDKILKQSEQLEKALEKSAGTGVGSLTQRIKELNKTRVDWRKEIRRKINLFRSKNNLQHEIVDSYVNYPWKPSSRYGILGKYGIEQPSNLQTYVIVAIDTSGSCFNTKRELKHFFTEIDSLSKELKLTNQGEVLTIQWDYEITDPLRVYSPGDWKNYRVRGGGGTNPNSVFNYLDSIFQERDRGFNVKEIKTKVAFNIPDRNKLPLLIFLTDGYFYRGVDEKTIKMYNRNEDNLIWFSSSDTSIYPKKNFIEYKP